MNGGFIGVVDAILPSLSMTGAPANVINKVLVLWLSRRRESARFTAPGAIAPRQKAFKYRGRATHWVVFRHLLSRRRHGRNTWGSWY